MPYSVLVHILNEDPIVGELEEMPDPASSFLIITSPRLRDGRDVTYLLPETNAVIYPWSRIHSVEIMPMEGEEKLVTYVRE